VQKIIWYLKQLLPLTYVTTFTENGRRRLCIWRMWWGRSFAIRYFDLAAEAGTAAKNYPTRTITVTGGPIEGLTITCERGG